MSKDVIQERRVWLIRDNVQRVEGIEWEEEQIEVVKVAELT